MPTRARASINTCAQCRHRKVRCDGRHDTCRNCDRFGFHCSFSRDFHGVFHERRRVSLACTACRAHKTRCSGEQPVCKRCLSRGSQCTYACAPQRESNGPQSPHRESSGSISARPKSSDNRTPNLLKERVELPSFRQITAAIEDYFSRIYPLPLYSFLHKQTLTRQIHGGTADPALVLAICGVGAQLHGERERSEALTDAAESLILSQLHCPSIFKLQALLLVIRQRLESMKLSKAFMLTALASRAAFALRLNYNRPRLEFLAQECRRRLMWSVFLLDGIWAGGLNEFTLCSPETVHLDLPSSEEEFGPAANLETDRHDPCPDLLAFCVRITAIRRDILKYTKKVLWEPEAPGIFRESIQAFEQRLHEFQTELPASASFCAENLQRYASTPWLARYLLVHTSWHQAHCDIFRFFLAGYKEALPESSLKKMGQEFVVSATDKCLSHAVSMTEIFSLVLQLDQELPLMDGDLAICAYHCTRIILYCFRNKIGKVPLTAETGLRCAMKCLQVVTRLFGSSAGTRVIRESIEEMLSHFADAETLRDDSDTERLTDNEPAPLSHAARIRQMLSIHSLVRQASFADDSPVVAAAAGGKEPEPESEPSGKGNASSVDDAIPDKPEKLQHDEASINGQTIDQLTSMSMSPAFLWHDPAALQDEPESLDFFSNFESDDPQHQYWQWWDAWGPSFDVDVGVGVDQNNGNVNGLLWN
ncbi:hypothetical protein VTN77DRAFT_3084 [Rasamsonia byssochlamydoides]|uniref:uncharacterized protein n=1 Tax=Rasamsonia byssochlamydoides TaxID=89139 RepID=UPI003742798B